MATFGAKMAIFGHFGQKSKLCAHLLQSSRNARKMATFGRKIATFGAKMAIFGHFWPKMETLRALIAKFAQCAQNGHFWVKNGHFWSKNWHFRTFLAKNRIFARISSEAMRANKATFRRKMTTVPARAIRIFSTGRSVPARAGAISSTGWFFIFPVQCVFLSNKGQKSKFHQV